jgi:hypothetical protein
MSEMTTTAAELATRPKYALHDSAEEARIALPMPIDEIPTGVLIAHGPPDFPVVIVRLHVTSRKFSKRGRAVIRV